MSKRPAAKLTASSLNHSPPSASTSPKPKRIRAVCSICHEDLISPSSSVTPEHQVGALSCGHTFHSNCVTIWLRTRSPTCPLCARSATLPVRLFFSFDEEDSYCELRALQAKYDQLLKSSQSTANELLTSKHTEQILNEKLAHRDKRIADLQSQVCELSTENEQTHFKLSNDLKTALQQTKTVREEIAILKQRIGGFDSDSIQPKPKRGRKPKSSQNPKSNDSPVKQSSLPRKRSTNEPRRKSARLEQLSSSKVSNDSAYAESIGSE